MRNWRVLTAVVAVVLALLAGLLSWKYLSDADERAEEDVELVDALVAKEDIAKGASGREVLAEDLLRTEKVPRRAVPDAALTSTRGLENRVAAYNIAAGQFIVDDTFVLPSQAGGFAGIVPDGKQAISITVDDTRGVAGFLAPNDRVNVILNLEIEDLAQPGQPTTPEQVEQEALNTTAFLLPGLKVLAVGETTATSPVQQEGQDTGDTRDVAAGIITLEVTARQALQIAHASQNGTIYLSLNPPDFDPETFQNPQEIVEAVNLFDQPLTVVQQVRGQLGG